MLSPLQAKRTIDGSDAASMNLLVNECFNLLCSFISFKRMMLARMLECRVDSRHMFAI